MRILVLNYEFPPLGGGSSPVAYELGKQYVQQGHTVDVVTMGYQGLPRREQTDGMTVYRVPALRARKETCRTHEMFTFVVSAIWFLRKHLKSVRYDLNHTHFLIPTGIVALWASRWIGLPYVVTLHGSDVPGYNNDRFTFLHKFTGPILRKVVGGAYRVIAPSRYLRSLFAERVSTSLAVDIEHIPNGIDQCSFVSLTKERIIVATGRLLPRKGFQHLIRAIASIDFGYELHIAGDGPMMSELRRLAKHSKTPVIFHGWMDGTSHEYRALLGRAAVYCLPSERENASISLLEAMSSGCAVVTSTAPGCAETVGEAGVTIPFGDVDALRTALIHISAGKAARALGNLARERVERDYEWDHIAEAYLYRR